MSYRKGTKLFKRVYNFPMYQGGLGDLIGQLPAVKYALNTQPHIVINLWVHDYAVDLCKKVFSSYKNINIDGLSNQQDNYIENIQARSPYAHRISNLSWHITDHGYATIIGRQVEDEHKNYLQMEPEDVSAFNLPEFYAVVATGYTSDSRVWKAEYVNEVSDYLNSIGITPVYLGKTYTKAYDKTGIVGKFEADYTKGINLIDKTNMFEAHGIMAKAKMVIGLDNGLLHLAGMTQTPIVAGFTTVEPMHRLPYRNNELGWNCYTVYPTKEELKCIGCQSNMNFADTDHFFTDCYYKDFACLSLMTPDKWIAQINKVLEPKTPQEKAQRAYEQIKSTQALNKRLKEMGVGVDYFDDPVEEDEE